MSTRTKAQLRYKPSKTMLSARALKFAFQFSANHRSVDQNDMQEDHTDAQLYRFLETCKKKLYSTGIAISTREAIS